MISEKYSMKKVIIVMVFLVSLSFVSSGVDDSITTQKKRSDYERYVDSLYQINIQIAKDYGRALDTNPNAVRPEPAIWFLDMNGNMYDFPPIRENDSIMRERESYKRRQDSLGGKQFRDLEKWYNE